jgi:DNA-binding transcriptional ArsR family regulator
VDGEDLVFKALVELEAEVAELTRFGVMKHLSVLEQAGLVVTRKQGRHKHHYLNPVPIRLIYERWIDKYRDRKATALLDLKDHVEGIR